MSYTLSMVRYIKIFTVLLVSLLYTSITYAQREGQNKRKVREIASNNDSSQYIQTTYPKQNQQFSNSEELATFTWTNSKNPNAENQYILEISRVDSRQKVKETFHFKTSEKSAKAKQVFKNKKPRDGLYRWQISEITTGKTSLPAYFSISNCIINFTITNVSIECLGFEGTNQRYKVCFTSNYSSASGDLSFNNPPSGVFAFDQNYDALPVNLVGTNNSLLNQSGSSASSVDYCFETVIDPGNVTFIGFALQGDDLNPSPALCIPGVSIIIEDLPTCICNDCDELKLWIEEYIVDQVTKSGNEYIINGTINLNQTIFGLEFQIQSLKFASEPKACSSGVSSIEESGVFLSTKTTINSSGNIHISNESVSGDPQSNNGASKNIAYFENAGFNGSIPFNLHIGVPGSIEGLNSDCCRMEYRICIKVKVYYDEDKCKSCVFQHCFEFKNK